ncbi:hypothetical protein B0H13DRAFT_2302208 [Mycena leptocephala]|nr:hypothetical protein B0H13DRAFT_2302208 [Mycena leptocephala]
MTTVYGILSQVHRRLFSILITLSPSVSLKIQGCDLTASLAFLTAGAFLFILRKKGITVTVIFLRLDLGAGRVDIRAVVG